MCRDNAGFLWRAQLKRKKRFVRLIAGAIKISFTLGRLDRLVSRSNKYYFPADIDSLAPLTRPKLPMNGTALGIDQNVKGVLELRLSVYKVGADALKGLRSDVIVTQDQCQVRPINFLGVEESLCERAERGAALIDFFKGRIAEA